MTFVLEHIGLLAGDSPVITDVSIAFEAGTMNVLLGVPFPVMAGPDGPTVRRILSVSRKDRGS